MSFADETYILERMAAGKVPGATAVYFNGNNPTPTSTFETAWDNSNLYTFLTTNMSSPTIVSSSANDAAAGTGARTVRIVGVDSTYTLKTEDVTLNGVSTVALTKNYMTINSIVVLTAGSGGTTAGNLTLAAGGTTHGFVLAGKSQSTSFIYCVPASYKLLIFDVYSTQFLSSTNGNQAQIMYSTNGGPQMQYGPWGWPSLGSFTRWLPVPYVFPEKTQIQGQVASASAVGRMDLLATGALLNQTSTDYFAKWI